MAVIRGFVLVLVVTLIHVLSAQSNKRLFFKDAVEQWQQQKCLFPSKCLYSKDTSGKCSDKTPRLLACEQWDVYNVTDKNEMFKATLCQKFYDLSIQLCNLNGNSNETALLRNFVASCLVSEKFETINFGNKRICSFAKNETNFEFMNDEELCSRNCENPNSPSSDVCKIYGYIFYLLQNPNKCSIPKVNQANDGNLLVTTQSATKDDNRPKNVSTSSSDISTENEKPLDPQLKHNDTKDSKGIPSGVIPSDTDTTAIYETTSTALSPAISLTDTSIKASRTEQPTLTTVLTTLAAKVPQSPMVTENNDSAGVLKSSVRSTTRAGSDDDETSPFVVPNQTDPDVLQLKSDAGITSTTATTTTAAAASLSEINSTPEHSDDKGHVVTSDNDEGESTENNEGNQSADSRGPGINNTPEKGSPAIIEGGKPEKGNNNLPGLKDKIESEVKPESGKKETTYYVADDANSPGSGHFLAYFLTAVVLCVSGYIIYHNKQKILAFIIEGRNSGRGGRQRSKDVKYSPLKSSVEEVLPSLEQSTSGKNFVY